MKESIDYGQLLFIGLIAYVSAPYTYIIIPIFFGYVAIKLLYLWYLDTFYPIKREY